TVRVSTDAQGGKRPASADPVDRMCAQVGGLFAIDALGKHLFEKVADGARPEGDQHRLRVDITAQVRTSHTSECAAIDSKCGSRTCTVATGIDRIARLGRRALGLRAPLA